MLKQILIPAALFAVTATGASAFNGDMLERANIELSDSQVSAIEVAAEMRTEGADRADIKVVLEEAGLDRVVMQEIKTALREVRKETRDAVHIAVAANDYSAFLAVAPDRLTNAINSEADFAQFVEAKELKEAGDTEGAAEIFSDLGIEKPERAGDRDGEGKGRGGERGNR